MGWECSKRSPSSSLRLQLTSDETCPLPAHFLRMSRKGIKSRGSPGRSAMHRLVPQENLRAVSGMSSEDSGSSLPRRTPLCPPLPAGTALSLCAWEPPK